MGRSSLKKGCFVSIAVFDHCLRQASFNMDLVDVMLLGVSWLVGDANMGPSSTNRRRNAAMLVATEQVGDAQRAPHVAFDSVKRVNEKSTLNFFLANTIIISPQKDDYIPLPTSCRFDHVDLSSTYGGSFISEMPPPIAA